jgi:hypothetical protein
LKRLLEVTEQVRAQILEDLRTGNKKLSFPSTEITLEKGKSKVLALGVKNTQATDQLEFIIKVVLLQAQVGANTYTYDGTSWGNVPTGLDLGVDFFYDQTGKTLGVTESNVYSIRATANKAKGVYMTKIELMKNTPAGPSLYEEKTFYINVV